MDVRDTQCTVSVKESKTVSEHLTIFSQELSIRVVVDTEHTSIHSENNCTAVG